MGVEYIYDTVCICIFLGVSIILTVITQFCLIQRTCRYWYVHIVTSITFFLSFFAIGLITVDLASSLYMTYLNEKGKDIGYFEDFYQVIFVFWEIVYWVIFICSWGLLPFFQSYVMQGHFQIWKKFIGVLWDNIIYYGICLLLLICCVVALILYLVFSDEKDSIFSVVNFTSIFILMTSLSNAFGFLCLVVLLGYGFGTIPIVLFRKSDHKKQLKYLQFCAAESYDNFMDKNDELNLLLCYVRYLDIKGEGVNRKLVEKIKKTAGKHYKTTIKPRKPEDDFTKRKHYVNLNKEVIKAIRDVKAKEYEFEKIKNSAFFIEDILGSKNGKILRSVNQYKISRLSPSIEAVISRLEFFWYKICWRCAFLTLFVLACILPWIFIWCEFTPIIQLFNEKIDLSIISLIMRLAKSQRWLVEFFSFVVITYLASIIFYALFKMKLFNYVQFVPRHTDAFSMLFASVALCRILPAFLFNFLTLCGITRKDRVSFFEVMANVGNFEGLSWIWFGEYFGVVFPIFIPVVILIVVFDVVGRCSKILGVKNRYVVIETFLSKNNPEQMKLGQKILKTQKKKLISNSPQAIEQSIERARRKKKRMNGEELSSSDEDQNELDEMPQVELNRKLSDISSDEDNDKQFLNSAGSGIARNSLL